MGAMLNSITAANGVKVKDPHGLTCLPIVQANQEAPFRLYFFFLHSPSP